MLQLLSAHSRVKSGAGSELVEGRSLDVGWRRGNIVRTSTSRYKRNFQVSLFYFLSAASSFCTRNSRHFTMRAGGMSPKPPPVIHLPFTTKAGTPSTL